MVGEFGIGVSPKPFRFSSLVYDECVSLAALSVNSTSRMC